MKLKMVGISLCGSLRGVARFLVNYVGFRITECPFEAIYIDACAIKWSLEVKNLDNNHAAGAGTGAGVLAEVAHRHQAEVAALKLVQARPHKLLHKPINQLRSKHIVV